MTGEGLEREGAGRENWCFVKHAFVGFYRDLHTVSLCHSIDIDIVLSLYCLWSQGQMCANIVQR